MIQAWGTAQLTIEDWAIEQDRDQEIGRVKDLIRKGKLQSYQKTRDDNVEMIKLLASKQHFILKHNLLYQKVKLVNYDHELLQFVLPPDHR